MNALYLLAKLIKSHKSTNKFAFISLHNFKKDESWQ